MWRERRTALSLPRSIVTTGLSMMSDPSTTGPWMKTPEKAAAEMLLFVASIVAAGAATRHAKASRAFEQLMCDELLL